MEMQNVLFSYFFFIWLVINIRKHFENQKSLWNYNIENILDQKGKYDI